MELCRYVVLNPVRANMVAHPRLWSRSSYRPIIGKTTVPSRLTVDWVLSQFGVRVHGAQEKYRTFVAEWRNRPRPWDQLQGQIYLGSESFISLHQPDRLIREIPRLRPKRVVQHSWCCFSESNPTANLFMQRIASMGIDSRRLPITSMCTMPPSAVVSGRQSRRMHDCKT